MFHTVKQINSCEKFAYKIAPPVINRPRDKPRIPPVPTKLNKILNKCLRFKHAKNPFSNLNKFYA